MKSFILAICFAAITTILLAQSDSTKSAPFERQKKSLAIVTGYYYYGSSAGELGISLFNSDYIQIHPFWGSLYVSSEFFYNQKLLVSPKIGAWASGGSAPLNMGLSFVYFTDFSQSTLLFRPEIGVGFDKFRLYYGRNMRITNTNFNFISRNLLGVNMLFNAKKLRASQKQRHRL